jgi:hypothetical protein
MVCTELARSRRRPHHGISLGLLGVLALAGCHGGEGVIPPPGGVITASDIMTQAPESIAVSRSDIAVFLHPEVRPQGYSHADLEATIRDISVLAGCNFGDTQLMAEFTLEHARACQATVEGGAAVSFNAAYDELERSLDAPDPLQEVQRFVSARQDLLRYCGQVLEVNDFNRRVGPYDRATYMKWKKIDDQTTAEKKAQGNALLDELIVSVNSGSSAALREVLVAIIALLGYEGTMSTIGAIPSLRMQVYSVMLDELTSGPEPRTRRGRSERAVLTRVVLAQLQSDFSDAHTLISPALTKHSTATEFVAWVVSKFSTRIYVRAELQVDPMFRKRGLLLGRRFVLTNANAATSHADELRVPMTLRALDGDTSKTGTKQGMWDCFGICQFELVSDERYVVAEEYAQVGLEALHLELMYWSSGDFTSTPLP